MSDQEDDPVSEYSEDPEEVEAAGFTSAVSSGDDEDVSDYFGEDLDPMRMLEVLDQPEPDDGSLQPFQIAKLRRKSRRSRARQAEEPPQEAADGALQQPKRRKGGKRRSAKAAQQAPEHVQRMLGQANLLYAAGLSDQAEDLLMEVIRQSPNLSDPYFTLGALHEAKGAPRKAVNFYMIAAHMSSKRAHDAGLWQKLAELSMDLGYLRQAVYCWQAALRRNRNDLTLVSRRADALAQLGEVGRAIKEYTRVLSQIPNDPETVSQLVRLYHRQGEQDAAIRLLEQFMQDYPADIDLTLINMLAELYIVRGEYEQALRLIGRGEEVLCADSSLPIDLVVKQGTCLVHTGHVADGLADWAKLLEFEVINQVDDFTDLYNAVVSACAALALYQAALPFVDRLVQAPGLEPSTEDFTLYCNCYVRAARADAAVGLYEARLTAMGVMHPRYLDVALSYVELLAGMEQTDVAATLLLQLEQALELHQLALPEDGTEQVALFLRKVRLYLTLGNRGAYLDQVLPLMNEALELGETTAAQLTAAAEAHKAGQIPQKVLKALQRRRMYARKGGRRGAGAAETTSVFKGYTTRDRRKPHVVAADEEAAALLAAGATEGPAGALAQAVTVVEDTSKDLLANETLFEAFVVMLQAMAAAGRHDEAKELVARASDLVKARSMLVKVSLVDGDRAMLAARRDGLQLLEVLMEAEAGDMERAARDLKPLCRRWPASWAVWSLYSRAVCQHSSSRHWMRQVAAQHAKQPKSLALALLTSHAAALSEQYAQASQGYAALLSVLPQEPLLLLCLAVCQMDLAVSKRVASDRNAAVLRGFAALHTYASVRLNKLEAAYNLGRAAHQLGLLHVAVAYYESVLQQAAQVAKNEPAAGAAARTAGMSFVAGKGSTQAAAAGATGVGLVREAAYNLSLIYKRSGAESLARQLVQRYLTV